MAIRIGLFGFGKTGSVVAKEIAADSELTLAWVCRKNIPPNLNYASHALGYDDNFAPFVQFENLNQRFLQTNPVDIIIDFSSNSACTAYDMITKSGIKIVSAISRYSEFEIQLIRKASAQAAILASPNITVGINWMMLASKLLRRIVPHADIEIVEEHFREKKETSGTALKLARELQLDPAKHISSIRVGGIVGKHEAIFGLPYQTIRLTHESISRSAFGTGAIFAAKWLNGQTIGMHSMENVFYEKFINEMKSMVL
jgi:4-hydroxy-tetrahydrodipicolinate reductase